MVGEKLYRKYMGEHSQSQEYLKESRIFESGQEKAELDHVGRRGEKGGGEKKRERGEQGANSRRLRYRRGK